MKREKEKMKERETENELDADKCKSKVDALLGAFESRFSQFAAEMNNIALFTNPFVVPDDKINMFEENLQLEIIDLKCNSVLKGRLAELPVVPSANDMISFWRLLPANEFEHLRSFAERHICRFG